MGKKKGGKKGKSDKKKSGKGSTRSARSAISDTPKEKELNETSKEFWDMQMDDLNTRIIRHQKECDETEMENRELAQKYKQRLEEKTDIESYTQKTLVQREDENMELQRKLIDLQLVKEAEKVSFEAQLDSLQTEAVETKDQLLRENENLQNKLTSMREYELQRTELMGKFQKIEEMLEEQAKQQLETIYNQERQMVVDKDRLRKEAVERVTNLATEFRKVSDKQMADTTKKALKENVSLNKQLQKYSDRTMRLIDESDSWNSKISQQSQVIELMEFNERELTKKCNRQIQNIKKQVDNAKAMENFISEYDAKEEEFDAVIESHKAFCESVQHSQQRHDYIKANHSLLKEKIEEITQERQYEQLRKKKLQKVLLDASGAIKEAVGVPENMSDVSANYSGKEGEVGGGVGGRDVLMENLLQLLNSAATLGVAPIPAEFKVEKPTVYKQGKTVEAEHRGVVKYQPGVLGLLGSDGGQQVGGPGLPTHGPQRVADTMMRSVACQTTSAPKAIFLANLQMQNSSGCKGRYKPLNTLGPLRKL